MSTHDWMGEGFPTEETYWNVERWIADNNLNQYGDPAGSMYAGGNPLFYSRLSRYSYILQNHPDKPWEETADWTTEGFPSEESYWDVSRWITENDLNEYGDPAGTMYAGGDPLFYSRLSRYEYLLQNHPSKPWEGIGLR